MRITLGDCCGDGVGPSRGRRRRDQLGCERRQAGAALAVGREAGGNLLFQLCLPVWSPVWAGFFGRRNIALRCAHAVQERTRFREIV
ncbi:hypothetical protein FTO74_00700 [Granulicella sp. WH15]|uniref:hypothetical protein n=1 Tax=Granulicella sp. WH15 TaxID=2602070 RepID=UPI00136723CE|nr:hypothetical protein [Granulicella sp. WH15]QHN02062.1 hypothetical protein FTO74_00700 [Granulicella sp. WH15]